MNTTRFLKWASLYDSITDSWPLRRTWINWGSTALEGWVFSEITEPYIRSLKIMSTINKYYGLPNPSDTDPPQEAKIDFVFMWRRTDPFSYMPTLGIKCVVYGIAADTGSRTLLLDKTLSKDIGAEGKTNYLTAYTFGSGTDWNFLLNSKYSHYSAILQIVEGPSPSAAFDRLIPLSMLLYYTEDTA